MSWDHLWPTDSDQPSLVIGFKMSGMMWSSSKLPPRHIMCNVLWAMPTFKCLRYLFENKRRSNFWSPMRNNLVSCFVVFTGIFLEKELLSKICIQKRDALWFCCCFQRCLFGSKTCIKFMAQMSKRGSFCTQRCTDLVTGWCNQTFSSSFIFHTLCHFYFLF